MAPRWPKGKHTPLKRRVDINLDGTAQLSSLPRIGRVMAYRIARERSVGGHYKSWQDLKDRVKGIGRSLLKRIQPKARMSPATRGPEPPNCSSCCFSESTPCLFRFPFVCLGAITCFTTGLSDLCAGVPSCALSPFVVIFRLVRPMHMQTLSSIMGAKGALQAPYRQRHACTTVHTKTRPRLVIKLKHAGCF